VVGETSRKYCYNRSRFQAITEKFTEKAEHSFLKRHSAFKNIFKTKK
jgi:hypothetical protein